MKKFSLETQLFLKMLLVLVIGISLLFMQFSCCDSNSKSIESIPIVTDNTSSKREYKVVEIDGCEYISYNIGYNYGALSHKGNCKYCVEKREREMDTLRRYMYENRHPDNVISIDSLSKLMKNKFILDLDRTNLSGSPLIIIRK